MVLAKDLKGMDYRGSVNTFAGIALKQLKTRINLFLLLSLLFVFTELAMHLNGGDAVGESTLFYLVRHVSYQWYLYELSFHTNLSIEVKALICFKLIEDTISKIVTL